MEQREKCTSLTQAGKRCGSFAVRDGLCISHHPEMKERKAEGSRRGGANKAEAKRAARQWAAAGEVISPDDLPAMLRATMIAVRDGDIEPSQATAIAALARASISLSQELQHEERLQALEEAAGMARTPPNVRRIA